MISDKILRVAGIALGLLVAAYFLRLNVGTFANVTFLGGLLLLEVLVICAWSFERRFFPLVLAGFVGAGTAVPLQGMWTAGRWVVLATGAVVGLIVWMRKSRAGFSAFHLIALFCACAAFASATVSPVPQLAFSKALSLLLLFLYGAAGARTAISGREQRFFKGLLWGSEIVVYITMVAYFALGSRFWGNPNSLGAVMSVGVFPILFWGWFTSDLGIARWRRLFALFLCVFLIFFSLERAGMAAIALVTLAFSFALRQYKLLAKVSVCALFVIGILGMVDPAALSEKAASIEDTLLYKGKTAEGVLGSRRSPWEKTISNLRQHSWFGTGYGTSLTGEDPGLGPGRYSSSAETSREHGSSYMAIAEWVGLAGVLPFILLIGLNAFHILRVGMWLLRTRQASHYSVPLAMVMISGSIHAGFEDWMFAVGSYLCVYFWVLAFLLTDLLPSTVESPLPLLVPGKPRPSAIGMGAVAPGQ